MKAIYLFMCLLFVSGPALKAQYERITIKTWKDYNLKGRVKYVMEDTLKILTFTPEGYLLSDNVYGMGKHFTYDKAGRLLTEECVLGKSTKKYTYNAQGVLIKGEHFDEGKHFATDLYDIYGNLQKTTIGEMIFLYKNTYDAQKKIIHIEYFAPSMDNFSSSKKQANIQIAYLPNGWMRYVKTYNNGDKVITEFDNKGRDRFKSTKKWEDTCTYDDNGNLLEHKEKWGHNKDEWEHTILTYNAQGEEVSYTKINDSNEKREYIYTYPKHDAMGNWTEKVTDSDGEKTTTKRALSYYE